MNIDAKSVVKVKLRTLLQSLDGAGGARDNVSVSMAGHYNDIRAAFAAAVPSLTAHLPPTISQKSNFAELGMTEATYFDLRNYVNTLLSLYDLDK